MLRFKEYLSEGINDPAIFKAVFLAGGPGSGKSFVVGKSALTSLGFKIINSDSVFEKAMKKASMEMSPENIFSVQGQDIRTKSKNITAKKLVMHLKGRLGLVIDGTGKDYAKIMKQKKEMESLGYDTAMIFVNTDEDTAQQRNKERDRSLPDDVVSSMWKDVQKNLGAFQNAFKGKMFIVDNSENSDAEKNTMVIYKRVSEWSKKPPENRYATKWMNQQMKNKQ
jgi:tRNA uridine 5-carbamoylmethylation protein Kti12